MASFTDGQPRTATPEDCAAEWNGGRAGIFFRCGVCGHRFQIGDVWRFVYMGHTHGIGGMGIPNALVCGACDGPDVKQRIVEHWREAVTRFWHLFDEGMLRLAERAASEGAASDAPAGNQQKQVPFFHHAVKDGTGLRTGCGAPLERGNTMPELNHVDCEACIAAYHKRRVASEGRG